MTGKLCAIGKGAEGGSVAGGVRNEQIFQVPLLAALSQQCFFYERQNHC
jgi:hypothetical protein